MTLILYLIAGGCLFASALFSREKTVKSLKKAWKSFVNIVPAFFAVLLLVSFSVAFLPERVIASLIGEESGVIGQILASVFGSLTLIPGFIAFPMAKILVESGAGVAQTAVFISTLMMVGVATAPLEASFFGWRATILRNGMAYCYSFVVGYVVWTAVTV